MNSPAKVTPLGSTHTFTRRADGMVIVTARQGIAVDVFRDDRHLDVIAREWRGEWE